MKKDLTPDQEKRVVELFKGGLTDINRITREVFNDPKAHSREPRGKAVARCLVKNHLNPNKANIGEFTDEQKDLIRSEMQNGSNSLNIARLLFKDEGVQRLSQEWRAVNTWVSNNGLKMDDKDDIVNEYIAPRSNESIVSKINAAVGLNLDHAKLSGKYKQYVEKLVLHLGNSRYKRIMNSYDVRKDRQLFEDQFIRNVWDQIDLTSMELDLVMNICVDTVNIEILRGHIAKLNTIFDDMEEGGDLKHVFSETVKAKTDELNQCYKRVSDNTKKLQGDRSERLKNKGKDDYSFLTIVQAFQEEDERREMLRQAEMERMAAEAEVDRLASMEEWRARILGLHRDDVV